MPEYIETRKKHFISLWREYDKVCEKADKLEKDIREMRLLETLIDYVAEDLRQLTAAAA